MATKTWRASPWWLVKTLREEPPDGMRRSDYRRVVFGIWRREVHPAWAKSTVEFFISHSVRWLWLVPGLFLGLLSLYGEAEDNSAIRPSPAVVWVVILVGFLVAALLEYHRLRRERDELADDPRRSLNAHLSKGYELRDRLLEKQRPKSPTALSDILSWVLTARYLVRRHTPAYYSDWRARVPEEADLSKQYIDGLQALAGICAKIGLP